MHFATHRAFFKPIALKTLGAFPEPYLKLLKCSDSNLAASGFPTVKNRQQGLYFVKTLTYAIRSKFQIGLITLKKR